MWIYILFAPFYPFDAGKSVFRRGRFLLPRRSFAWKDAPMNAAINRIAVGSIEELITSGEISHEEAAQNRMNPWRGEVISKIAALARLKLEEKEVNELSAQFWYIMSYMGKLNEVDVSGVNLTVTESANAFTRPDAARPSQDVEAALLNAPRRSGDQFMVPKVVE